MSSAANSGISESRVAGDREDSSVEGTFESFVFVFALTWQSPSRRPSLLDSPCAAPQNSRVIEVTECMAPTKSLTDHSCGIKEQSLLGLWLIGTKGEVIDGFDRMTLLSLVASNLLIYSLQLQLASEVGSTGKLD